MEIFRDRESKTGLGLVILPLVINLIKISDGPKDLVSQKLRVRQFLFERYYSYDNKIY